MLVSQKQKRLPEKIRRPLCCSASIALLSAYLLRFVLCECACQLVGARCVFVAASYAGEFGYDVVHFHAAHQCADALQIAVATANELHVLECVAFYLEVYQLAASALCFVVECHDVDDSFG